MLPTSEEISDPNYEFTSSIVKYWAIVVQWHIGIFLKEYSLQYCRLQKWILLEKNKKIDLLEFSSQLLLLF